MRDYSFDSLLEIMKRLRRECPWDRVQTNDSIKGHTIEEAYEVVEAIDRRDDEALKAELGDLLLHVVFHAEIAEEEGRFTIGDVIRTLLEKLVRRHPHVFGDVEVDGADEVKRNWEQIKMDEGRDSVIDGVPSVLPALLKAYRVQDKASKVGFDWVRPEDVWDKVLEEIGELRDSLGNPSLDPRRVEEEFGDLLFALVNYARFIKVNPEDALRRSIDKFSARFRAVEKRYRDEGKNIHTATLEELDRCWDEVKREENGGGMRHG
ncbi:MAG: nucleoside triphosphate pyrophosphohydrolase [Bacteroidota bacterium]|nr:nucleoside triphosphate pyrophosphohydrolase [Bacteroidota bacterium]